MKQLSIKKRIYRVAYAVIGFAAMVGVTVSVTTYLRSTYTSNVEKAAQGLRFINRFEMHYAYRIGAIRGLIIDPTSKELTATVETNEADAEKYLAKAEAETSDPKLLGLIEQIRKDDKDTDKASDQIFSLLKADNKTGAQEVYQKELGAKLKTIQTHMEEVRKLFEEEREGAAKSRDSSVLITNLIMGLILLGSTSAILVYSLRLAQSISGILEMISQELSSAAGSVRTVSGSVSSASQTLSETTTQQAAAIEETVSSMEEMSSMLSQTAQNSQTTLQVSEEGQQEGQRGKAVIAKMLSAMDEIHASNERLESIVKMIEQIQSKTKVINDIVFETRLLSFNASIEAARAGAHGKGFAVVAEEVGKLASMSGKAAEEIRTLLETSTAEVVSVVSGTQERVNAGRQVSQDCQVVFEVMSGSLEKIGSSVRMITAATKEQEQGVKQTNQAMGEMDQVTQRNSASAESLASQSGHLSNGAAQLLSCTEKLREVIFGSEAVHHQAGPPPQMMAPEVVLPMNPVKSEKPSFVAKNAVAEPSKQTELDRSDSRWKAA